MKLHTLKQGSAFFAGLGLLAGVLLATSAMAEDFTINWMQMPVVAFGSTMPNNTTFYLPGIGNVQMTYTPAVGTIPGNYTATRSQISTFTSGLAHATSDTYTWNNFEFLGRTHNTPPEGAVTWTVTYTFLSGPVAEGDLALGILGLGRLDSVDPDWITTASVAQNGTYLGESGVGGAYGGNLPTSSPGSFSLQNILYGNDIPGDPSFNTALAVVRIDDNNITSLTVTFSQIGSDGTGVNIGFIQPVPEPATFSLLALSAGALACLCRFRRRSS